MKSSKPFLIAFIYLAINICGVLSLSGQSILPPLKDKLNVINIVDQNYILAKTNYNNTPTNSPDYTIIRSK